MSRRRVLQAFAATGVTTSLAGCQTPMSSSGLFFQRTNLPIGIQLYTLADMLRTDPDGTVAGVARIGYKSVEIPSYLGKTPQQLRAVFDKNSLKCTAAHVGMRPGTNDEPGLQGDLAKLAADMHVLGATHVYAPSMAIPADISLSPNANEGYAYIARVAEAMGESRWKRLAGDLTQIGHKLKADGIGFGYHNHNFEFVKVGDRTGFDILVEGSDPAYVSFELDVGWAAAAGHDPTALFQKHSGRYSAMHVKDIKASSAPNTVLKMDPTEVGSGRLAWKTLLPAAHKAGVRQFYLEQEPPFEKGRMEAAQIGYDYLSTLNA